MAASTPPIHRRLAEIGLRVGGPYGFALAGGHAIAALGILERPSEDVDLFADWQRRADFPAAVDEVIAAYRAAGLDVQVDLRLDTFARLHVTDPNDPDRQHRVELVANWRAQPPVHMDIGPVLHPDDVMAGKMDALYNRAAARDFPRRRRSDHQRPIHPRPALRPRPRRRRRLRPSTLRRNARPHRAPRR